MWKRFLLWPLASLGMIFVTHAVAEMLAERYECRKWYNFFNMSVRCHVIKRISYMCDTGLEDWLFDLRTFNLLPVFETLLPV